MPGAWPRRLRDRSRSGRAHAIAHASAALACVRACMRTARAALATGPPQRAGASPPRRVRARTLEQDQRAGTGASMSCAFAVRCAAL
ncbi:hypothetical protein AQ915_31325 [Burkholderia pseudomallei]|nr:hypothetical protein AQ915_31325 [Burkholderia pseudomallei]